MSDAWRSGVRDCQTLGVAASVIADAWRSGVRDCQTLGVAASVIEDSWRSGVRDCQAYGCVLFSLVEIPAENPVASLLE